MIGEYNSYLTAGSAMMSRSRRLGAIFFWLLIAWSCYMLVLPLLQQSEVQAPVQQVVQVGQQPIPETKALITTPSSPRTHHLTSLDEDVDYQTLIDLNDFSFNLNTECPPDPGPVVVVVHSAPKNFAHRQAIRLTWGSSTSAKLVFMLGAVSNESLQWQLDNESLAYDDLVQGSFNDTYRNLTYKHVMALKWLKYHCVGYQHVLKTDDDIFVNLKRLTHYIQRKDFEGKNQIFCDVINKAVVKRTWRSKWHVTYQEYKYKYYPPYCPGWLVLYSQDLIENLYRLAQKEKYFWIDDVHVTGILGKKVHVRHKPISKWMMSLETYKDKLIMIYTPEEQCEYFKNVLFGPNELPPRLNNVLWEALKDCPI